MQLRISKSQFKFYAQTGMGYLVLWVVIDTHNNSPGSFWPKLFNNIWLALYLTLINILFFEYALPFLRQKKHTFIRVLWWLPAVFGLCMLFSFGLFAWRATGIGLHVYTAL